MKNKEYDFFSSLQELSGIGTRMLEAKADKEGCIKRSVELRSQITDYSYKTFLPPIEREDIVTLAHELHKFNVLISRLDNAFYENAELYTALNEYSLLFSSIFENKLRIDYESFENTAYIRYSLFEKSYARQSLQNNEYGFDVKSLIKYVFFGKIKECFDQASKITDEIVKIKIKNS